LEGIEGLKLHDQYIFSLVPLKIPFNEKKAASRLNLLA
jgi:hypothetical protein